jgi:DNA mismatch endonuclease (patch repair protein)
MMADTRTAEQRRTIMKSVGQRNTGPELFLRRWLHSEGYRYRLHRRDLPGTPDIVFPARRKAIFVNGCFWHGHGCSKGQPPKSRPEYWLPKIEANRQRDARAVSALQTMGWQVETVWQCEMKDRLALQTRLRSFLDHSSR